MGCFNDPMFSWINKLLFLVSKVSPQNKNNTRTLITDDFYHIICKFLPTIFSMGVWFVSSESKNKNNISFGQKANCIELQSLLSSAFNTTTPYLLIFKSTPI